MCFTFKKNNKRTKKPVNCFLQDVQVRVWGYLFSVLEFNFDCKSLVVCCDIAIFVFPFLVDNDVFFTKMATPPLMRTET